MAISVAARSVKLAGNAALGHHDDAVRQRQHFGQIGGNDKQCHAARREIAQDSVDVGL